MSNAENCMVGDLRIVGRQASIDRGEIMGLHQLFSSLLIRWFGGILLVFSAFSVMYAQSPKAPTASEEPAEIDHIWQKASSNYDAERTALLKEVDAIASRLRTFASPPKTTRSMWSDSRGRRTE